MPIGETPVSRTYKKNSLIFINSKKKLKPKNPLWHYSHTVRVLQRKKFETSKFLLYYMVNQKNNKEKQ